MARYSRQKLARATVMMLGHRNRQDVIRAVAHEILAQHWQRDIDLVVNDIGRQLLVQRQELTASVTSARPLPKTIMRAVESLLQRLYNAKSVHCTAYRDPSLKGGFVIKTPEITIDASVARQLAKINHS